MWLQTLEHCHGFRLKRVSHHQLLPNTMPVFYSSLESLHLGLAHMGSSMFTNNRTSDSDITREQRDQENDTPGQMSICFCICWPAVVDCFYLINPTWDVGMEKFVFNSVKKIIYKMNSPKTIFKDNQGELQMMIHNNTFLMYSSSLQSLYSVWFGLSANLISINQKDWILTTRKMKNTFVLSL